jgi:hypothetical protein
MKSIARVLIFVCLASLVAGSLTCDLNRKHGGRTWKKAPEESAVPDPPDPELYDRFGGWKGLQSHATGFFRVELVGGSLWLITPEGNAFLSKGVNAFWCPAANQDEVIDWLQRIGFNTLGAWSSTGKNQRIVQTRIPYAELLNLAKTYAGIKGPRGKNWPDIFSEKFEASVREQAREKVMPHASDPYLIGWWTDNELKWAGENPALLDAYMDLPSDAAGRRAVEDFLAETFGSLKLPEDPALLEKARDGFVEKAVRHYAEVTTSAIREYDENHLILGPRIFFTPIPWRNTMPERLGGFEALARAGRGHWDVLSINAYFDDAPTQRLRKVQNLFQGPILISEFNIWSANEDQGKGGDAEWEARAEISIAGASLQLPELFAEPYIVGYHYFPFSNPAAPRDNNSRAGLVNFEGEPREALIKALSAINSEIEEIHRSGTGRE